MKKTNKVGVVLMTALIIAVIATLIFEVAEQEFGAGNVFIVVFVLLPLTFIWLAVADLRTKSKARAHQRKPLKRTA